jgi:hypothetical protein
MTLFDPAEIAARVHAADHWPTNGHLIEAVAALDLLRPEWLTLDATYGEGLWWTRCQPDRLVTVDIDKTADVRADYRTLPFPTNLFDATIFDPPYVCKGGRTTSGIVEMDGRYGLNDAPRTPPELQAANHDGLDECIRVTKPGGMVLVKYQNQVSSGHTWAGAHLIFAHAVSVGLELVQEFVHVHPPGPQPHGRTQRHAANNYSLLLVLQKVPTLKKPA